MGIDLKKTDIDTSMVFCKNCCWYYSKLREISVDMKFIYPGKIGEVIGSAVMCQHPDCFCIKTFIDIINGYTTIHERYDGQAQLNKDCNCSRYEQKRRWYRLWIK